MSNLLCFECSHHSHLQRRWKAKCLSRGGGDLHLYCAARMYSWMDAKPFIIHNNHLQLSSTASPGDRVLDCSDPTFPVLCADFDYQATLTSISTLRNGLADMTSTFRFTASAKVNGTVVQCKDWLSQKIRWQAIHSMLQVLHTKCVFKLAWYFMGGFEPKLFLPNNYCSTAGSFGLFSPMLWQKPE